MIQGDHESRLSMRINSFVDHLLNCSSPPSLVDPTKPSSSFCTDNYQSRFDEEEDGELNFIPISTSDDHYASYEQKPHTLNYHMIMDQFNPNPNLIRVEGKLKAEQFWSNQDSINTYINNMGMSSDHIPDMADIDCLWDFDKAYVDKIWLGFNILQLC